MEHSVWGGVLGQHSCRSTFSDPLVLSWFSAYIPQHPPESPFSPGVGGTCMHSSVQAPPSFLAVKPAGPTLPGFCRGHWRKPTSDWAVLHTLVCVRTRWFLPPNCGLLLAHGLYPAVWHLAYSDGCDPAVVSFHGPDSGGDFSSLTTPVPCR